MYAINDEFTAYCFDNAVAIFGSRVESELTEAAHEAKNASEAQRKQSLVLARWLRDPGETPRFREPPRKQ